MEFLLKFYYLQNPLSPYQPRRPGTNPGTSDVGVLPPLLTPEALMVSPTYHPGWCTTGIN
jgi:hypothetical protein